MPREQRRVADSGIHEWIAINNGQDIHILCAYNARCYCRVACPYREALLYLMPQEQGWVADYGIHEWIAINQGHDNKNYADSVMC